MTCTCAKIHTSMWICQSVFLHYTLLFQRIHPDHTRKEWLKFTSAFESLWCWTQWSLAGFWWMSWWWHPIQTWDIEKTRSFYHLTQVSLDQCYFTMLLSVFLLFIISKMVLSLGIIIICLFLFTTIECDLIQHKCSYIENILFEFYCSFYKMSWTNYIQSTFEGDHKRFSKSN